MNINIKYALLMFIYLTLDCEKIYSQTDKDLPIIEDFEKDAVWPWKPWRSWNNSTTTISKISAHTGNRGLNFNNVVLFLRNDISIGMPGQAISIWVMFTKPTRVNLGFGISSINDDEGFYICADVSTNTLHFAKSPDYTYPLLKSVNQTFKYNVWYRIEVVFNTSTHVTGRLYAANGTTVLNTIDVEIPDLSPGGIAFNGLFLYVDDIRGGTRYIPTIADSSFAPKLGEPLILKNILFETNKNILLTQSYPELDKLAAFLIMNPTLNVLITGHTDSEGDEAHNQELSTARAQAVANYLINGKIDKKRISYKGVGSKKPIAPNTSEVGRQKNRRVECIISY